MEQFASFGEIYSLLGTQKSEVLIRRALRSRQLCLLIIPSLNKIQFI